MNVKTEIVKVILNSNSKEKIMSDVMDVLDKDKKQKKIFNSAKAIGIACGLYYAYCLYVNQFYAQASDDSEHVMGFKPQSNKQSEE